MLNKSIFSKNLKNLRQTNNMLQKEVAALLKDKYGKPIKPKTYQKYEEGTRYPHILVLEQLEDIYGYPSRTLNTVLLPVHMLKPRKIDQFDKVA